MQFRLNQEANGSMQPKRLLSIPKGGLVVLQVLDAASTIFFEKSKDILLAGGLGIAAPNLTQGFQVKQAAGIIQFWWKGELWATTDTNGALLNVEVVFELSKSADAGDVSRAEFSVPGTPAA